jgi:glycosyltransferase involved in cell wall biosynthesis
MQEKMNDCKVKPLVSTVITTYNRPESVKNAIKSVLAQTYSPIEIIVVEDGTDSGIEDWVQEKCLTQIRYIRHKRNLGLAAARNTAIEIAAGEYFAFCDDDDQWPADFAERLVNAIQNGPEDVDMSLALGENKKPQCQKLFEGHPRLTEVIRQGFTPPVGSQLYRTDLLRDVGGYNVDVKSGVDHDLWISLADVDPRVAVSWGEAAIVSNHLHADRMTTVEGQRRQKIYEALDIWKPKIVDVFGQGFYEHFCYSYERYLNYNFFVQSAKRRKYVHAVLKLFNKYVLNQVAQGVFNKITGRRPCNLFPVYKGR